MGEAIVRTGGYDVVGTVFFSGIRCLPRMCALEAGWWWWCKLDRHLFLGKKGKQ